VFEIAPCEDWGDVQEAAKQVQYVREDLQPRMWPDIEYTPKCICGDGMPRNLDPFVYCR